MRLFILIILIAISISGNGQSDRVVDKIIEIGKTDNQTMNHLDVLCNRFGGRPIGSDAFENAAEWVAHKFTEWGMQVEMDEAVNLVDSTGGHGLESC
ncbi:MAG: hypothetical protein R2764_09385 [Bacteroidales bacterium]